MTDNGRWNIIIEPSVWIMNLASTIILAYKLEFLIIFIVHL